MELNHALDVIELFLPRMKNILLAQKIVHTISAVCVLSVQNYINLRFDLSDLGPMKMYSASAV